MHRSGGEMLEQVADDVSKICMMNFLRRARTIMDQDYRT